MKKAIVIIFVLGVFFSMNAFADENLISYEFIVAGENVIHTSSIYNEEVGFMIPLRDFFEGIGASVEWSAEDMSTIVSFDGKEKWSVIWNNEIHHSIRKEMNIIADWQNPELKYGTIQIRPENKVKNYTYYSEFTGDGAMFYSDILGGMIKEGRTYIIFSDLKKGDYPRSAEYFFKAFRCIPEYNFDNKTVCVKKMPKPFYSEIESVSGKLFIGNDEMPIKFVNYHGETIPFFPFLKTIEALGAYNIAESDDEVVFDYNGTKYLLWKDRSNYDTACFYSWDDAKGLFEYSIAINPRDGLWESHLDEDDRFIKLDTFVFNEYEDAEKYWMTISTAFIEDNILYVSGIKLFEHFGYKLIIDYGEDTAYAQYDESIEHETTCGVYRAGYAG